MAMATAATPTYRGQSDGGGGDVGSSVAGAGAGAGGDVGSSVAGAGAGAGTGAAAASSITVLVDVDSASNKGAGI